MNIIQKPTPHHNARPHGSGVSLLVIHADASKSEAATTSWLADPVSKVSYHYLVGRDGTVYQFVPDDRRAWHAGISEFQGVPDCNDYSIGLSFSNDQVHEEFPEAQVDAGAILAIVLCLRHGIPVSRIAPHSAIATPAGRKHDPGPRFPWNDFIAAIEGKRP